ncbi:CHAT domain-containing protein [Rhodococcus erythropolis]|nr:CHAT domain-containing protein [Rhodococcus erythropolis]
MEGIAFSRSKKKRNGAIASRITSPAIVVLENAFARGKTRKLPANVRSQNSVAEVKISSERATVLLNTASGNGDLEIAAEELGFVYNFATMLRDRDNQYNALARLGMVHSRYASPDTDLSRDRAMRCLLEASDGYKSIGNMQAAAIDRTNAANVLLEKIHPTPDDFELAKKFLDFSFIYKLEDTVDWAYSEFVLGMYYVGKPSSGLDERISNLARARDLTLASLNTFFKCRERISANSVSQLGSLQAKLFEARANEKIAVLVREHIDDIPFVLRERAEEDPLSIAGIMANNPISAGLEIVPVWLDDELNRSPDQSEIDEISQTRDLILRSLVRMRDSSDWSAINTAMWWEARLSWIIERSSETYSRLVEALGDLGSDTDPEDYFRRGLFVSNASRLLDKKPKLALLQAIVRAFKMVVGDRHVSRIESFLEARPGQIRFIACALCEYDRWDDAVDLLEHSRVILCAGRLKETATSEFDVDMQGQQAAWVYLTHSPNSTYVIVKQDGVATAGFSIAELRGARLIEITHSFAYESIGLLNAQIGGLGGQHLSSAVSSALQALDLVVRVIEGIVPSERGVCLILGGLYSSLPISSAILASCHNSYRYVTVVPSRTCISEKATALELSSAVCFTALTASNAPGVAALDYPEYESEAIREMLSRINIRSGCVNNANGSSLVDAVKKSQIVHYSGHSATDPDPRRSRIILNDGEFDVDRILRDLTASGVVLATFSSCQSAQPSTFALADEFLSVQSAVLYSGCRYSIGSLWPVADFAACVFMSRLYSEIATSGFVTIESLHRALRSTQLWVQRATLEVILEFRRERSCEWDLPVTIRSQDLSIVPLRNPRHWAAFYLSSRSL